MPAVGTVPARGWYIEVDHPSGFVWRPDVVGEPTPKPTINGYPKLTIPVRASDRWAKSDFEDQPLRAWYDGVRQPVDRVETPTATESGWVLEGRGGTELDTRVRKEVDDRPNHEVFEEIINQETAYTPNVDTPPPVIDENTLLREADTDSELSNLLQIPDTAPVGISGGQASTLQTCFVYEGEDEFAVGDAIFDSAASGEFAEQYIQTSDEATASFSLGYDVPANDLSIGIRWRSPNDADMFFDISVDGSLVASLGNSSWSSSYQWYTFSAGLGSLSAGSHDITITVASEDSNSDALYIDVVAVYDNRFSYTFDNSVDSDNALSGPQTKPDLVEIETINETSSRQISGGRVESTWNDTSGSQYVAVSNDGGATYTTANNSETVETDFGSASSQLRAKLGLSRYGSGRSTTPTTGYNSQSVDVIRLLADLDNTPRLINQSYDGDAMDVLKQVTPPDSVFQLQRDGDNYTVEYCEAGQRTADEQGGTTGFEYIRRVERAVDKVIIKGSVLRRRDERITAGIGTAVPVSEDELVHGRETVYDPATDTEYLEGTDYSLNAQAGEVVALSNGAISDGQELAVDYGFRPVGESSTSVSDPNEIVRSIPGLTTDIECQLVAEQIAAKLDEPLKEGTVTVETDRTDWSLVESRVFEALPTEDVVDIRDAQPAAEGTDIRFGSRQPVEDIIGEIRDRVSALAQRS
ncbi:hypothetical protein [Haloarcula amylovorans]|uniref:hypothetical protein n=1 Tax=Haloarcula amylovorans TaxID=2562280 RepID=UPI0010765763|nr:hypothetical protein [Halomicroarcula amylolytica]